VTSGALHAEVPRRLRWPRWIADRAPVLTIVLVLILAAILMNMTLVRDAFEREEPAWRSTALSYSPSVRRLSGTRPTGPDSAV
jgi:hypothetical protein